MQYKIISDYSNTGLVAKVNEEIKNGWIPQGGVSAIILREATLFKYEQAMIKNKRKYV